MTSTKPAGDSSPHAFLTTPASSTAGVPGRFEVQAPTPEAVLAIVPHMLGFYPSRSLVVLALGDQRRVVMTFRYDLPGPGEDGLARDITDHVSGVLHRNGFRAAMLVGYGGKHDVLPVVAATAARLDRCGIEIAEALRAEGGRYWSVMCREAACCPPQGRPYDPGSHPAAAALAGAGLTAHPDRDSLARTLQRPAGSAAQIAAATRRARQDVARLDGLPGSGDPALRAARIGRREVRRAIGLYRAGGRYDSVSHLAWLAVLVSDLAVRDDAWTRMDPRHSADHSRLWTDVLRAAATESLPASACLLAYTSWQAGNGAMAVIAVDRALAASPRYTMARLLNAAIRVPLPPSRARLPITPAGVAACYAPACYAGGSATRTATGAA